MVPVVYTYLDDFGAWAGAWIKKGFAEPEAATVPGKTHVPVPEPQVEPVPGAVSPARAGTREG